MKYRADIDGLRAIAVSFVILFHYELLHLPAGYLGVDIFFVISGYLITSIIARGILSGSFNIIDFYARRAARLFPALFLVLAFCLLFGWVALSPQSLKQLGTESFSSATFLSNIYFSTRANYWADSESSSLLLHTWSLSVEEQYYLAFPLFMVICARFGSRWIIPAIIVLLSLSIVVIALFDSIPERYLFYLTPFRMSELALGGLAALSASWRSVRGDFLTIISMIALVALIVAVISFSTQDAFPGSAAVVTSLATASLLKSGERPDTLVNRVLGWRPFREIGVISYPLYLWHWPVLIAVSRISAGKLTVTGSLICLGISLFIAFLSHRFVEKHCRRYARIAKRPSLGIIVTMTAPLLVVGMLGFGVKYFEGFPSRIPDELSPLLLNKFFTDHRKNCIVTRESDHLPTNCSFGPIDASKTILVWGDSHATVYAPAMSRFAVDYGYRVRVISKGGCPPLMGVVVLRGETERSSCQRFKERAMSLIREMQPDVVVIAGRWHNYAGEFKTATVRRNRLAMPLNGVVQIPESDVLELGLRQTLDHLAAADIATILLGPTPEFLNNPNDCVLSRGLLKLDSKACDVTFDVMKQRIKSAERILAKTNAIRPVPSILDLLCADHICSVTSPEGPLYLDAHHLEDVGVKIAFSSIKTAIVQALEQ